MKHIACSSPVRPVRGFTLVELMITITLVIILALAGYGAYESQRKKAQDIGCMKVLRQAFWPALASYIAGNDQVWPQEPKDENGNPLDDDKALWRWWSETMSNYGIATKAWLCPSEYSRSKPNMTEEERKAMEDDPSPSYIPGNFGPTPGEAMEMPSNVWMNEREDFHDNGMNVLRADGVVFKEMRLGH